MPAYLHPNLTTKKSHQKDHYFRCYCRPISYRPGCYSNGGWMCCYGRLLHHHHPWVKIQTTGPIRCCHGSIKTDLRARGTSKEQEPVYGVGTLKGTLLEKIDISGDGLGRSYLLNSQCDPWHCFQNSLDVFDWTTMIYAQYQRLHSLHLLQYSREQKSPMILR